MHAKIVKILKSDDVECLAAFIKGPVYGVNDGGKIIVNLLHCLVPTIIHEILHEMYPDYSEKKILTLEEAVYDQMTFRQKINILNMFNQRCAENEKKKARKRKKTRKRA